MTDGLAPPIANPLGAVSTERLRLRQFEPDDLDGLAAVFANREVWQFPYGRAFTRAETEAFLATQRQQWFDRGFGLWIVELSDSGEIIGYTGLSVPTFLPEILPAVEVGWRFAPQFWGQGYAAEGARAALREGFTTLGLTEITSVPQAGNPASSAVCDRIGMRFDREVVIPANDRRGELTGLLYRMTSDDWVG